MYIVAIGWLYVALMMAITEQSVVAGVMTFLLYGLFPLSIILYLMGTPRRRRLKARDDASPQPVQAAVASKPETDTEIRS